MIQLPDDVIFFERGWLSSNNCLLLDASQACLIDTGYYTHATQTAALVNSKLHDRELTTIINTHLHSDHCGGNAHLQRIYPNVLTLVPEGQAIHIKPWDDNALTYKPTGQHCPTFTYSDTLHSGDSLNVAGRTWTVFSAPGHDPHSLILFDESDRILISADALWENGFGVVFPEIEGLDAFDEVAATLKLIGELEPRLVLPGHGKPFSDVVPALSRAHTRLNQFTSSPAKHSEYAAKVLLKFKLLEFQKIRLNDFMIWACSTPYLILLHSKYGYNDPIDSWINNLLHGLERSGACRLEERLIVNI